MATGFLADAEIQPDAVGTQPAWQVQPPQWSAPYAGELLASIGGGPITDTQPVDEPGDTHAGARGNTFVDDYYERIHVTPQSFDVGNLVGAQALTFYVWNAYTVARPLAAINESGTEGISLSGGVTAPYSVEPLRELQYSIDVTLDGPPTIDASFTFDFDTEDPVITIVGSRVIPWLFIPDGEVLERLEWATNVIRAYDGTEQRQQIRQHPRRYFEYGVTLTDQDRQRAENLLYNWGGRVFALPVWNDGSTLQSGISAGASTISLNTVDLDYHAGGLVILTDGDQTYEVVSISSMTDTEITLLRVTASAWPAGTFVYPVRLARLPERVALQRFSGAVAMGRLRWRCTDVSDWDTVAESTYRSYPVLNTPPNWTADIAFDWSRKLAELDNGSGQIFVEDESGRPTNGQSHRWLLDGRDEISAFRSWLYARRGRLQSFWLPTFAQDLVVTAEIGAAALNIDVQHSQYTQYIDQGVNRRDIRILLNDGTEFYRRVTASTEVDSSTERLTIDADLGQTVPIEEIAAVSFMHLVRLDSDAVELAWFKHDVAQAATITRNATNDI